MIKLTKGQIAAIRHLRSNSKVRIYYEKELFAFYSNCKEKALLNIQTAKLLYQSGLIELDVKDGVEPSIYKLSRLGRNISLYSF
jgi:hypothetical protein